MPIDKTIKKMKDVVSKDSLRNPSALDWFVEFYKN